MLPIEYVFLSNCDHFIFQQLEIWLPLKMVLNGKLVTILNAIGECVTQPPKKFHYKQACSIYNECNCNCSWQSQGVWSQINWWKNINIEHGDMSRPASWVLHKKYKIQHLYTTLPPCASRPRKLIKRIKPNTRNVYYVIFVQKTISAVVFKNTNWTFTARILIKKDVMSQTHCSTSFYNTWLFWCDERTSNIQVNKNRKTLPLERAKVPF